MLNILIPMAGHGKRFATAGYKLPKPLIPVLGRSMIELVIDNLRPREPHRFIFVCQQAHITDYGLDKLLRKLAPDCVIYPITQVTEGAACTVLIAREQIDNDQPLVIANCDQYVDINIDDFYKDCRNYDGSIMTMWADDPKWSFVKYNDKNEIIGVVEKSVVSNDATVGIYYWKTGHSFVRASTEMIAANERVNNEFYVAPAYDHLIASGAKKVGVFDITSRMYGLGVPDDLDAFLAAPVAKQISKRKTG
jgi:NDP-sugar pyrophosphorylase family protein